jgi:hypothetical protein
MPTRKFWSFFTVAAILCFLFATNSRGVAPVPVAEQYPAAHFQKKPPAESAPVLTARIRLHSGFGISRRQQVPASFSERCQGNAHLSSFSFDWQIQRQIHAFPVNYDAGCIFISRIRSLLYPKHSFW